MSAIPSVIPGLTRDQLKACCYRPDTLAWALTRPLPPESRYYIVPHVRYIAGELVDAVMTPGSQLTIEAPVRHGKSELTSRWFPFWYLTAWPGRRVMLTSYGDDFAATWGAKVRDLFNEWGHLFGLRVDPSSAARDRWDLQRLVDGAWVATGGGMVTAGTGGSITGKGTHLLIVDDPFKDAEESMSPRMRKIKWDWLQATAMTRLEPGGVAIVMQARWHEDDFIGRIHNPDIVKEGRWRRIRIPALAEANDPLGRAPGEALWPARYSRADLLQFAEDRGSYWFGALYQQNPVPLGGGIFQAQNFHVYRRSGDVLTLRRPDATRDEHYSLQALTKFQTWDLAIKDKTSADYTVCATWAVTPKRDLILLDLMRIRVEAADHLKLVHQQYARHLPSFIGIESVQYQAQLVQMARRDGLPIKELRPDRDKVTRALTAAARYEAAAVWHPTQAPWLDDLERELLGFPQGEHDDMVDAISYAAAQISSKMASGWRTFLESEAA